MNRPVVKKTLDLGRGPVIEVETGRLARQADGAVVVTCGDAMLLATVVSAKEAREGVDFMPLSVDYQEKFSAAGRFPGGFLKRESRPSDYEILICRIVDRALRPLFPDDYHAETQVIIQMISMDPEVAPDALAGFAASAAISITDIPFGGPISEVRVARIDGEFVINPAISEMENADINLIVSGTLDTLNMVEGEMDEVSEAEMVEAIKVAHEAIKKQCQFQVEFREASEAPEIREYSHETSDEELSQKIHDKFYQSLYDIAAQGTDKQQRSEQFGALIDEYIESLGEEPEEDISLVKRYFGKAKKEAVRNMVLDTKKRLDGRDYDEVRPIWGEINYLKSVHGSAVFTRGETQALAAVTLGTKLDEKIVDGVMYKGYDKFLLHYNFPPFSVGEARFLRGASRREIGHGNLAMRSLKKVLPSFEECPYTIRITSDILESNGSSSMATVCSGSMALMDAGVKVRSAVSGIAMGMISDAETGRYAVLSDILGDEDHLGDMDFKVTGTDKGIVACQMDIKVEGLSFEVLTEALIQARAGRDHILNVMNETVSEPREDYKPMVPRMHRFQIKKDFIGAVIGSGGKVIQEIQAVTGTSVSIEEEGDFGIVEVASADLDALKKAVEWIEGIVAEPEVGDAFDATVEEILAFGAVVNFLPGKSGLLHISEIDWNKTEKVEDVMNVGDTVKVQLIDADLRGGKFKLSRKRLLEKPEGYVEPPKRPRDDRRGGRDDRRGGRRDDRRGGGRDDRGRDRRRD